eukprot:5314638-Pyramimonas_sp.AAC.1
MQEVIERPDSDTEAAQAAPTAAPRGKRQRSRPSRGGAPEDAETAGPPPPQRRPRKRKVPEDATRGGSG